MKLVSAVIRPFVLDNVRDGLMQIGIQGLTAYEVKGFGRQRGQTNAYRGGEYTVQYIPKIKIELLVSAEMAPKVVETIMETARTGKTGDGKVFVMDLTELYRIRTGEKDDAVF